MSLNEELKAQAAGIAEKMPDVAAKFNADTQQVIASGITDQALKLGATAPAFELPDQLGRTVKSADLLPQGPLVISFYRGHW